MQTAEPDQRMPLEPFSNCKYLPAVCRVTVVATFRVILGNCVLFVSSEEV